MKSHVTIIGAGVSGLALGWFLKKRFGSNLSLTILEKENRAGGWIRTTRQEGFLFEQGPRSFRTRGISSATLELLDGLGLQEQVILSSSAAQKRYLFHQQRLQLIPSNFLSFLCSPFGKYLGTFFKEGFVKPFEGEGDESIYSFFSRRFSPEIANVFIDPLVSGIFAGDMHKLSMRACFPQLFQMEQKSGSLIRGGMEKVLYRLSQGVEGDKKHSILFQKIKKASSFTFLEGMESLIKKLSEALFSHIRYGVEVKEISFYADKVEVRTNDGLKFLSDQVYLALPASATSRLLKPFSNPFFSEIETMEQTSVAVVHMGWRESVLKPQGFGYLVPTHEKEDILGMVWDSVVFPQQNCTDSETRITAMLRMFQPEMTQVSQNQICSIVEKALFKHLNIKQIPQVMSLTIAKKAIAQYAIGHQQNLLGIKEALKKISCNRVHLTGSAWHGVAVNQCIEEAKTIAERINPQGLDV